MVRGCLRVGDCYVGLVGVTGSYYAIKYHQEVAFYLAALGLCPLQSWGRYVAVKVKCIARWP